MTIKHLKFFGSVLAFTLFLFSTPTYAQERVGLGGEESFKGQEEINSRTDNQFNNGPSSVSAPVVNKGKEVYRDSVVVVPTTNVRNKPEGSIQKKPEDETLSYNLLYFIFQKFKVSEMMD